MRTLTQLLRRYNGPTTLLYSRKAAAFLELVTGVPFVDVSLPYDARAVIGGRT
jgi:hypothetical protein